jgi:hypothetical protein
MRRRAVPGHPIHLACADLEFDREALEATDGGVQALVAILFGMGDEVRFLFGYRSPQMVDKANGRGWHHLVDEAQLNEWYAIISLCRQCHRGEFGTLRAEIKDFCEMLAITRGLEDLTKKIPETRLGLGETMAGTKS